MVQSGLVTIGLTLFSVTLINSQFTVEDAEKSATKCMNGTSLKRENMDEIFNNDAKEPNREVKCFMSCYMMEMKQMDRKGRFEYIEEAMDAEVKDCADRTEDDLCERAYRFVKCVRETKTERS